VLLDREVRLGSAEDGGLPLRGLERTIAVIEPSEDGPCLEPRGLVTILVNDRPPLAGQVLRAGDRLILGPAIARVLEVEGPCGAGNDAREEPPPSKADDERLLHGLLEILEGPAGVDRIDRGLELALGETGAARAALVVRDVDGRAIVHRSRSAGLEGDVELATGSLRETEPVLSALSADDRTVLTAPIVGPGSPTAWLVLEWTDTPDPVGHIVVAMVIGAALGTALRGVRRRRIDATMERLAMIGRVMAGVAHDLKNLMSGLRTGVFYLDDTLTTHEESRVREAWSILKGAQASIQALVSDMVAYSRRDEPELETADLAAVVRRAVELARDRADSRGIALEAELEPAPLRIDPQAIERCVVNLLVNAIDAAPASSGHVRVSLADEGDRSVLRIADNGPGIPVEIRERVFDLLYSTKGVRGTGFGLAITREIVEAHGGTVELESGDPGATFAIRLPVP
jgi:signal transduction histidine kinase